MGIGAMRIAAPLAQSDLAAPADKAANRLSHARSEGNLRQGARVGDRLPRVTLAQIPTSGISP